MQSLVRVLWEIALWRRGPRDLPASGALLALVAAAYGVTSMLTSWLTDGPSLAVLRGVADLAFTAAVFWACLAIGRRTHRLVQTLIAVLGTGTLLAIVMIVLLALAEALGGGGPLADAVRLLLVPLQVWGVAVLAHIVRQALDQPLVTGVAVATTYVLLGTLFIERLLPAMVG